METYSFMRELADSWVLLAMFVFFVGVILWAFRPGSTDTYTAVAHIPLRDDPAPQRDPLTGAKNKIEADHV